MSTLLPGCLVCVAGIGVAVGALATSVAFTQERASTIPVSLEFRVIDRDGQPVLDLTSTDLQLRFGGRDRPIRAVDLKRPHPSLTPPFATNTTRGRDLVFVIDEESILPASMQPVTEAVATVRSMLNPTDRIGVLSLHPNGLALAPTDRREIADRAMEGVKGRAFSREGADDLSCRTRLALQRLTNFFNTLPRGATTTVLLFSAALAVPAPPRVFLPGQGACILQPVHFDEFQESVRRSAAQLYGLFVVDPGVPENLEKAAGLEKLTGAVDGEFQRLGARPSDQLRRIVDNSRPYYVIWFDLERAPEKNAIQAVDLRVARDNVRVHIAREVRLSGALQPETTSPRDMMRVATEFRALPLRAAAYPSANPGEKTMRVVVLFEPEGAATLTSAMAAVYNAQGRLVTQWVSEPADLDKRPVLGGLIVAPGTYRLRVAAVDSTGRSGAVDQDVRVEPIAAGAAKLSAMVLGVPQGQSVSPKLQFGGGDAAAVMYFEAYGPPRCAGVEATLELADNETGPARMTAPASPTPIDQSDGCILFGGFEIAALKPGDYIVRAIVTIDGRPAGRLTRTLRKTAN